MLPHASVAVNIIFSLRSLSTCQTQRCSSSFNAITTILFLAFFPSLLLFQFFFCSLPVIENARFALFLCVHIYIFKFSSFVGAVSTVKPQLHPFLLFICFYFVGFAFVVYVTLRRIVRYILCCAVHCMHVTHRKCAMHN